MATKADRFNPGDLADLIETEDMGETGLINDLIHDFAGGFEEQIAEMEKASREKQFRDLERYAHSLKSSARLLGLRATSYICEKIEDAAHDGASDLKCIDVLRAEIYPAVEELISFDAARRPV